MALPILRDDALASTDGGFVLRISLPWIRSLPLSSVADLTVAVDDDQLDVLVEVNGDLVQPAELAAADGGWFVQDRLAVVGRRMLSSGVHDVSVSFGLAIPYLAAGPAAPLTLPFRAAAALTLDTAHVPSASVAERGKGGAPSTGRVELPAGWTLAASAFNWTPEVIEADRSATDIAAGIVADGIAQVIEVELGQLWRSFPEPSDADVDAFREQLDTVGGSVSIVGASIDDWSSPTRRRDDDERLAFLIPQLRAAHRLGATGARLPIGQAGTPLLKRLLPTLHELDIVLYEEVQGQQSPSAPGHAAAYDAIAQLDDPHVRLLVDISMLMPALPPSYLARLRDGGVPSSLLDALATGWRDPATHEAVIELLQSGGVPPQVHTMFMNLVVRFGRSAAADLREVLPLVNALHLKFWDLDDTDGRVTRPIRDVGAELARVGFTGTLCSEWGGHEWLDGLDPADTTRAHLRLARTALAEGAAAVLTPREESWLTPSAS